MANKKNYWYVLVMTDNGPKFVTKVNYSDKTAEWNYNEEPLELDRGRAQDLSMGLTLNSNMAYAVCQSWEIDSHPYRYSMGKFEWKWNEEEEEDK